MSGTATYTDWIAVDWGTSNLRIWAMQGDQCRDELRSDQGMSGLTPEQFEPVLLSHIAPWLGQTSTPVIACGMVGSRQGWSEAPYRTVPTSPVAKLTQVQTTDPRLTLHILPGLKQDSHPDVMRGEETQIAGYLSTDPEFDGVLCLPGTHSKWCRISAGEIVSFQTFMTGELFHLLGQSSVLRHSVSMAEEIEEKPFLDSVSEMLSRPETLATKLFQIRASDLLDGTSGAQGQARLSGLLLGAELAATRPYWLGQHVVLIGEPVLSSHYAKALDQQGVLAQTIAADQMTLKGLTAAYMTLTS